MKRERQRTILATSRISGRPPHYSAIQVYEKISEVSYGRKSINSVSHSYSAPFTGPFVRDTSRNELYIVENYFPQAIPLNKVYTAIRELSGSLDQPALQTSSQFGLLQNIAELDDTVANFTLKYWKKIQLHESYAAVKWGTAPMISDLRNMLSQVAKLGDIIKNDPSKYESVRSLSTTEESVVGGETWKVDAAITVRQSGSASLPDSQLTAGWLDYFGLHPDLKTAWDLVPLSFVVDWFIPVSKFLDAFKAQGWVSSALFSGCISSKVAYRLTHVATAPGFTTQGYVSYGKIYIRNPVNTTLTVLPKTFSDVNRDLLKAGESAPTLQNVADAAYLMALKSRRK